LFTNETRPAASRRRPFDKQGWSYSSSSFEPLELFLPWEPFEP